MDNYLSKYLESKKWAKAQTARCLLEEIAFVIGDRGWKNCRLVEFVTSSTKNNMLNKELVDKKTLERLDLFKKSQENNV